MRLWPLIMVAGGGLWTGSAINNDVKHNTALIDKIHVKQEAHIDEAVRTLTEMSTKLDILIQQRSIDQENE